MIKPLKPPADPQQALQDAGLQPRPWSAAPHAHFPVHAHPRAKRLFVVRGDICFNGQMLAAPAGILISPGYEHSADVGDRGVECVEVFE